MMARYIECTFYNLDAIISVGYRVNSHQATQFRIWATERLKEYIIKGYTMNDEKMKDPKKQDKNYVSDFDKEVKKLLKKKKLIGSKKKLN